MSQSSASVPEPVKKRRKNGLEPVQLKKEAANESVKVESIKQEIKKIKKKRKTPELTPGSIVTSDIKMSMEFITFFKKLGYFNFDSKLLEYGVQKGAKDEEGSACKLFEEAGLIPSRPAVDDYSINCPAAECNSSLSSITQNNKIGWRYRCRRRKCGYMRNPLLHTFFEHGQLSFHQILRLLFCYIRKQKRIFVVHELGISPNVITKWYQYCLGVCQQINEAKIEVLGLTGTRGLKPGKALLLFLRHISAVYQGPFSRGPGAPPALMLPLPKAALDDDTED